MQEGTGHQVTHGAHSEASPLMGMGFPESGVSERIRELAEEGVCSWQLQVSDCENWCNLCISVSKFIPVSVFLLHYTRNNYYHNADA